MLAAVTTCEVTLLDLTSSRPPISLSSISNPVASSNALCATWSTDGAYLYVAWSHGALFRYEKSGKSCGMVWKTEEASGPPVAITTRDKDTILVAYSSKVVAVDLTKKRLTVELLKSSEPLVSLALLNDASILAACSRSAVQLYDLASRTLTAIDANIVLSAIHAYDSSSKDEALAFTKLVAHPYRRRLCFLACGSYLVVLSTRKPQAPLKVVRVASEIVGIAGSPASKGIVVVATVGGQLCIVDVEAEQSVIRTIECGVPLTTVVVSTDGLSAITGGEHGQVLRVDLRASERLPQTIFTGKKKQPILALSVPVRTLQSNSAINSPAVPNIAKGAIETNTSMRAQLLCADNGLAGAAPPRVLHKSSTSSDVSGKDTRTKPTVGVLSPKVPRVSQLGSPAKPTKLAFQSPARATVNVPSPTTPRANRSPIFTRASRDATTGSLTGRSRLRNVASSSALASEVSPVRTASRAVGGMGKGPISSFPRSRSSASIATSIFKPSSRQLNARPDSQISRATTERTTSPDPSAVSVSAVFARVQGDGNGTPPADVTATDESCPPSPSPAISKKPVIESPEFIRLEEFRPPSVVSTSSSTFMRGLDEDEREGKKVKWSSSESDTQSDSESVHDEDEKTARLDGKVGKLGSSGMARMRRAMTPPCSGMTVPLVAMQTSPMKSPAASIALGEAQDFLKNTIREIMYEEHAQQREELRALHLDMVKMGRNWKTELRALMDEYVSDFKTLREENESLRRENERLRRGY